MTTMQTNGAKVERRGYCRVCHRALKNPKYVELGVGPICAAKTGAAPAQRSLIEAEYDVARLELGHPGCVWIVDLDRGARSVTNDADRVVARILADYPGYRIIYRDSLGNWDELKHDGARFTGFAPARDMAIELDVGRVGLQHP